jgi:hypothetical protein
LSMFGRWLFQTLFMYRQWLYQDIVYAWTVVISRHCLRMDSGFIKTLFMHTMS